MADLFWLPDAQWAIFELSMLKDQTRRERKNDRQIVARVLHLLTSGYRWRDCSALCGPRATADNRFSRRPRLGFW
ncbi:transposase [Methylobacterium sp. P31]